MSSEALPEKMVDFKDYLAVLKRRRWVLLGTTLAVVAAVSLYSLRQPDVYTSRAEVLLKLITANPFDQRSGNANSLNVSNERQLASSGVVIDLARQALSTDRSVPELRRSLTVEGTVETQILTFRFRDRSPEFAQRGAQAFADSYLKFKRDQASGVATSTINGLNAQADVLRRQLTDVIAKSNAAAQNSPEKAQAQADQNLLNNSLSQIQTQVASYSRLDFSAGDVIEPATLPRTPSSPKHGRNIAMGVLGGLLLGVLAAFLRDRLDDRIATSTDANRYLGYPVLATVPRQPRRRNGESITAADPDSLAADAYRRLRSNVVFRLAQDNAKVVVVSSAFADEGKTTTAANLALALTHLGKRVLLVSADLRRPSLHRLFGLRNEAGLAEVLIGLADVEDVVQRIPGVEGLELLTSGGETERPAELLQDVPLRRLLEEQRERVDVVVIDSAPVLAVADTLSLAALADGVVMVVDSTSTTRQTLREATEQLDAVGARVLGVVINKAQPAKRPRYTRTYDADDARAAAAPASPVGSVRMGDVTGAARPEVLATPVVEDGDGAASPGRLRPLREAHEAESA